MSVHILYQEPFFIYLIVLEYSKYFHMSKWRCLFLIFAIFLKHFGNVKSFFNFAFTNADHIEGFLEQSRLFLQLTSHLNFSNSA